MLAQVIAYILLVAVLGIAAATDWHTGKIYNWLTYPAVLTGLVYWSLAGAFGSETGVLDALTGFAVGLVGFALILTLGGLGGGDMKLMAAVGAISAMWEVVLATAVYGLVIAAVWGVCVMIRRGLVKQTLGRIFGAALMKAARVKADIEQSPSPTVPFGTAAAVGGLLAGAEQMLNLATPWAWLGP